MSKAVCSHVVVLLLLLLLAFAVAFSAEARSSIVSKPRPALSSFKINATAPATARKVGSSSSSCSYTLRFTTSCSSPSYTRDEISLDFGDAYGNEVYVPRLDDPRSGAFEACSVDTYDIYGPCTYDVCYLYVYRSGYDGWRLKTVEVYGGYYDGSSVSFYYDANIPRDVWYGFDYCNGIIGNKKAST